MLQYKKRSGDLEQQVLEKTSELEKLRLSVERIKVHASTFFSSSTFYLSLFFSVLFFSMNACVFLCLYIAAVSLGLLSSANPALRTRAQPGHTEQTYNAGGGAAEVSTYLKCRIILETRRE